MPLFKMVMFFRQGDQGWTETLYRTAASAAEVRLEAAINLGLIDLRRAMMTSDIRIAHLRVSNVNPPRDADFIGFPGNERAGTFPPGAAGVRRTEQAVDAVNVRMFAGPTAWRNFLMRAVPSNAFTVDGELRNAGNWQNALENYWTEVRRIYQLQKRTVGAGVNLTAVAKVNDRIDSLTTAAAIPGAAVDGTLLVKNALGITAINTLYRLLRIDPGNVYVVRRRQILNYGTLVVPSGTVHNVTFEGVAFTQRAVVGITSRRPGRPSYQPAGKQRVQRA